MLKLKLTPVAGESSMLSRYATPIKKLDEADGGTSASLLEAFVSRSATPNQSQQQWQRLKLYEAVASGSAAPLEVSA